MTKEDLDYLYERDLITYEEYIAKTREIRDKKLLSPRNLAKVKHNYYYLTKEREKKYLDQKNKAKKAYQAILDIKKLDEKVVNNFRYIMDKKYEPTLHREKWGDKEVE